MSHNSCCCWLPALAVIITVVVTLLVAPSADAQQYCYIPGYTFYQGKDSNKNDIGAQNKGWSPGDLAEKCLKEPTCKGFNTNGWLKSIVVADGAMQTWSTNPWQGFYKRNSDASPKPTSFACIIPGYTYVKAMDSVGDDLGEQQKGKSPAELASLCSKDPTCVGFNTLGHLKSKLVPQAQYKPWNNPKSWEGLYVRDDVKAAPVIPGYKFYQGKDSAAGDLNSDAFSTLVPQQLADLCTYDADCKAFNTLGYLKKTLQPQTEWRWNNPKAADGIYVKELTAASSYEDGLSGQEDDSSSYMPHVVSRYEEQEDDGSSVYTPQSSSYEEQGGDRSSSYTAPQSSSYEEAQQGDDSSSYTPQSSSYEEVQQGDDSSSYTPQSSSYEEGQRGDDSSTYTPYSSSYEDQQGETDNTYAPQRQHYQSDDDESAQDSHVPARARYDGLNDDDEDDDRRRRLLADGHSRKLKLVQQPAMATQQPRV